MAHRPQRFDTTSRLPATRVGQIAYANVAPVYFGLNRTPCPAQIAMTAAPPATLNALLAAGELDISPVSSAAYAQNADRWLLLPDLSISCCGPVMSVLLVSRLPFDGLKGKRVLLTRESDTAAALSRYLFASRGIDPVIETGVVRSPEDLKQDTAAGLVIGDAALQAPWRAHFPHVWDLGQCWRERTGLPFVFAVWAVRKAYARRHPHRVAAVSGAFQRSRAAGMAALDQILPDAAARLRISRQQCRQYYRRLNYDLGPGQIRGLQAFFEGLRQTRIIPQAADPAFFSAPEAERLGQAA